MILNLVKIKNTNEEILINYCLYFSILNYINWDIPKCYCNKLMFSKITAFESNFYYLFQIEI